MSLLASLLVTTTLLLTSQFQASVSAADDAPLSPSSSSSFRIRQKHGGDSNHHDQKRRVSAPSPRIINGVEADPALFPYVVVLTSKHILKCAGSLIAPDLVLTAAHCSESFDEVQVGRVNRSDDTELYDSLIVESIHTHPEYFRNRFLDPDPHDYAIVKVFGSATIPTRRQRRPGGGAYGGYDPVIRINRNDNVPYSNQPMQVAGWGAVDPLDWNRQSDVLRETDAYYIPTEDCKGYVGSYKGQVVDFSRVVVDGATLCAMNFDELTDSCRGDSGGPLVVRRKEGLDDNGNNVEERPLLVGVVSAGYGCANPSLPALYARVSHVQQWIRDKVCELSADPPADFDCPVVAAEPQDTLVEDEIVFGNNATPCDNLPIGRTNQSADGRDEVYSRLSSGCLEDDLLAFTNITLELQLDTRPSERGWILRVLDQDRGVYVTVAERPIFSYARFPPSSVATEVFTVPNNREYQLTLLDSFGDGDDTMSFLGGDEEAPTIVRVLDADGVELLSANRFGDGDKRFYTSFDLTVGVLATESPTATLSPSESMTPTSAPTEERPFIVVVITFGAVPQNIGFRLERLYDAEDLNVGTNISVLDERQSMSTAGQQPDKPNSELLHIVYPGSFSDDLIKGETAVTVPLQLESNFHQTYRFTMTSNEGLGFADGGGYQVWLGGRPDRKVLFEGGDFYYEDSHTFVLEPLPLTPMETSTDASSAAATIRVVIVFLSGLVCAVAFGGY